MSHYTASFKGRYLKGFALAVAPNSTQAAIALNAELEKARLSARVTAADMIRVPDSREARALILWDGDY